MKVKFTPTARREFLDALAYIKKENPTAAVSLREKSHDALSRLTDFPESGRVLPEFTDLPFREVIVAPYRFFYVKKEGAVWVVAVWHSAQLPTEPQEPAKD